MTESALYYFLRCVRCDAQLQLPSPMLDRLFGYPVSQATNTASVAVSCHRCKRVAVYALRNTAAPYPVVDSYVFSEELRCEEKNCRIPLKVIAVRSAAMTIEDQAKDGATWGWDELRCPSGYLIPKTRS